MRYAPRLLTLHPLAAGLAALLTVAAAPSCQVTAPVYGSGVVLKSDRQVSGFHGVEASGPGRVIVTRGGQESLRIECDDNLLPHIFSTVEDGILRIGFEDGYWKPSAGAIYRVSALALDSVRVRGSVDLTAESMAASAVDLHVSGSGTARIESVEGERVDLHTSGSGGIWVDRLEAQDAHVHISGSGSISVASGELDAVESRTSGSGELRMPDVRTQSASVHISGSGSAAIWTEEALSAHISGSGTVDLRGDPTMAVSTSGSGSVRRRSSAQQAQEATDGI